MALDFVAGCLGGCASVVVGHPLDTVKVHLQTQESKNPKYKGTFDCIRSLIAKDGIRGIYRGMSSPLAGVAGINAVIFGVYGNSRRQFRDPEALYSIYVAATAAGIFQSILSSPVELAKSRVQVSDKNMGPLQCMKTIYKNEGIRGVYRGFSITVAREVPAFGAYFVSYEYFTRSDDNSPVSTTTMLVAGGMAGVLSWLVSYPIDVLKTRVQTDGLNGIYAYKNTYDCLKKSVAAEGYGFLVRGLTPTLVRAFPVNAACFTVVTWTMRLFDSVIIDSVPQVVVNIQTPETAPA